MSAGPPRVADFAAIEEAVAAVRAGTFVIVVDDEARENEGDLLLAAERVTPEAINFMVKHARGLITVPMTADRLEALELPQMVSRNTSHQGTAFAVSVGAKDRISAAIYDRISLRIHGDPDTEVGRRQGGSETR